MPPRPAPPLNLPPRHLRVTAAAQTAVLFVQAAAAGLLLASVPAGRTAHGALAGAVLLAVVLHLASAVLAWRRGTASRRQVLRSSPMLLFTVAQAALGFARVRELHVPLGVLMFGASILILTRLRHESGVTG